MANKSAVFSASLAFTDAFNQSKSLVPPLSVTTPYAAQVEGTWDVVDGAVATANTTIPLGSIGNVTGFLIRNNTANGANPGIDVELKINTTGAHTLTPGAMIAMFSPQVADPTTKVTELKLTLQAGGSPQVGAGQVSWIVFGDPV